MKAGEQDTTRAHMGKRKSAGVHELIVPLALVDALPGVLDLFVRLGVLHDTVCVLAAQRLAP